MTNFFAVFGLPSRPVIDVVQLSDLYANKSKTAHPDRGADSDFATLNEAFRTLSDPVSRLWHLLAITGVAPRSTTPSPEINGWFGQVASGLRRFDQLLQPLSQETSSLLRAMKIREVQPAVSELDHLADELTRQKEELLQATAQIDARWSDNLAADRVSLAQIACDLRFIEKWLAQIAERRLRFQESANY